MHPMVMKSVRVSINKLTIELEKFIEIFKKVKINIIKILINLHPQIKP